MRAQHENHNYIHKTRVNVCEIEFGVMDWKYKAQGTCNKFRIIKIYIYLDFSPSFPEK